MTQPATEAMLTLLGQFGISPDPGQLDKFSRYAEFLLEYNEKVNLTAITDPEGIAIKHFADSVIPLSLVPFPEGSTVIDVGTGAGFPGVPMKILRPDLSLTLLDSLQKRLTFLGELSERIGRPDNRLVHARAEAAGADPVSYTHLRRSPLLNRKCVFGGSCRMIQLFSIIGTPLGWIMYQINNFTNNYGLTLIIFSILLKVCMIPLGIKQQKGLISSARMQPKMRAIQKAYGNNKQRYSERCV